MPNLSLLKALGRTKKPVVIPKRIPKAPPKEAEKPPKDEVETLAVKTEVQLGRMSRAKLESYAEDHSIDLEGLEFDSNADLVAHIVNAQS